MYSFIVEHPVLLVVRVIVGRDSVDEPALLVRHHVYDSQAGVRHAQVLRLVGHRVIGNHVSTRVFARVVLLPGALQAGHVVLPRRTDKVARVNL